MQQGNPVAQVMTVVSKDSSIDGLCQRLDSLLESVVREVGDHQRRFLELRRHLNIDPPTSQGEVRGAVLAGAHMLLEAVHNLESEMDQVRGIVVEQQRLLNSLRFESRTDALTGLINRRAFDEEYQRQVAQTQRTGAPLALLLVDIDHFKLVNDTFGHAAGDKVLRGVANVLTNALREMDVIARCGGEEFAALLPDANLLNACRAAERLRTAIGTSTYQYDDYELDVTVSIGVTAVDTEHSGLATDDILKQGDDALYAAKRAGRNCVFVFQEGWCQPLRHNVSRRGSSQRRRWLRFLMDELEVRLQTIDDDWKDARVLDESLMGIGLRCDDAEGIEVGDEVQIDYRGEERTARVMNIRRSGETTRIGLKWLSAGDLAGDLP